MLTGMGLNQYDQSSMEHYGEKPYSGGDTETNLNMVASSESRVVGLQTIFRLHRQEMLLAH